MKLVILLITASISLYACGQNISSNKVPSVVQNTIRAVFPKAMDIEWEMKKSSYEAEFDMDSTEYTVYLDATGKIIVYKQDIRENELPVAITSALARDHAGYRIDDADKIQKDGITYYQVELDNKRKKERNLLFSADGQTVPPISHIN